MAFANCEPAHAKKEARRLLSRDVAKADAAPRPKQSEAQRCEAPTVYDNRPNPFEAPDDELPLAT
jgi:hypothetical protein